MQSLSSSLAITGAMFLASMIVLGVSAAPIGTPLFFACVGCAVAAYLMMLTRIWREDRAPRRALWAAFALAVAFRLPLMAAPVGPDNDMVRYRWDGRVQHLGYNPFLVLPADPEMAATHTDETRMMPSRRWRTPYLPSAQLFFRLVVGIHDSSMAMKLALVLCDLLTMVVVWRWLAATGRREGLALAYAWNPLVVLEVAHSGHIDAFGALWIAASAYWLARRRTTLASIAFVLAVTTKLLPIVLLPLYWKRVRLRDAAAAAAVFALLYLPFAGGGTLPLGAVPNVLAYIRFNGPVFRLIAAISTPQLAAVAAVVLGLLVAVWARWRLEASDPAAWAWPMAVALACAPVVYPWYLLPLTPFLLTAATFPLMAWTFSVIPAYVVWEFSRRGGPWAVPVSVMAVEYALPCATAAAQAVVQRAARVSRPTASPSLTPRASPPRE
jgi:alpha-1,6-mannosyltransferase